jgi:16S rRNA C967 or C1407 C5-methylase (RsmB/RsmF family)
LNSIENEDVVDRAVRELGLKICEIPWKPSGALPGFQDGHVPDMGFAVRIPPSSIMEGFFYVKLVKTG